MAGPLSPLAPHGATPSELKARLEADALGRPYLVYRDADGVQQIFSLAQAAGRIAIGRSPQTDVPLTWDGEVSRVHATLEQVAGGWAVVDDGLSRNGSFVNHERVRGRRLLADGDAIRCGETVIGFRDPAAPPLDETVPAVDRHEPPRLSVTQHRVLAALCRPFAAGTPYPVPASNQEIAGELFLSIEAVKSQLRVLFQLFDVDRLPRHEKRVRLVERALESGAVDRAELERGI